MQECREYAIERWKFNFFDGVEADDLCNITKLSITDSVLISCDKDMLMLEGENYNPQKREFVNTSKEQADYYFWSSMITGDGADNIKGIPKKGEKFVEKAFKALDSETKRYTLVFNEYLNHFGECEGVKEFYKNYMCLKMLDKLEGFTIPTPIKYEPVNIWESKPLVTKDEFGQTTYEI